LWVGILFFLQALCFLLIDFFRGGIPAWIEVPYTPFVEVFGFVINNWLLCEIVGVAVGGFVYALLAVFLVAWLVSNLFAKRKVN